MKISKVLDWTGCGSENNGEIMDNCYVSSLSNQRHVIPFTLIWTFKGKTKLLRKTFLLRYY